MATVLTKTLIVMEGYRADAGRPSTCFTFSQKPERALLELVDELELDDADEAVATRWLQ